MEIPDNISFWEVSDKEGRNVENELTHLFLGIFATLSIPRSKTDFKSK